MRGLWLLLVRLRKILWVEKYVVFNWAAYLFMRLREHVRLRNLFLSLTF